MTERDFQNFKTPKEHDFQNFTNDIITDEVKKKNPYPLQMVRAKALDKLYKMWKEYD